MPLTTDGTFSHTGHSGDIRSWLTTEHISAWRLDLMPTEDVEYPVMSCFFGVYRKCNSPALPALSQTSLGVRCGCLAVAVARP